MIIGIHGKAGTGKDTFAQMLIDAAEGYSFNRLAFADPVYDAVDNIFRINSRAIKDKEAVIQCWNMSLREMLQKVGTDMVRNIIGDHVWVQNMDMRVREAVNPNTIITDVRYPNEANYIKDSGGLLVFIVGPNQRNQTTRNHSSENGLTSDIADMVVNNNGSLEDLDRIAINVIQKLCEKNRLNL